MSEFLYLYRGGDSGRSPEVMQETMQKWMTWLKDLAQKGHIKDQGQPLERSGKLVKGKQKSITDGPFANFNGVVDEINEDRETLKVMVTIFGRSTPVELEFGKVEKIE